MIRKLQLRVWIGIGLVLLALVGIYVLRTPVHKTYSLPSHPEPTILHIKKGTSSFALIKQLHQEEIIRSPEVLKWYLRLRGLDTKIRQGTYSLPSPLSLKELTYILTEGEEATLKITIPEGRTSWEIYSLLKPHLFLDSLTFDSLVHNMEFAAKCSIPENSLEGYLFPDTYEFSFRISEAELLYRLAQRTRQVFTQLQSKHNFQESPTYKKYGRHGVLTLASIVEEEAAVRHEQTRIAGVFYNRLKKGWPLGADPTVRFLLKKLQGPLYRSELRTDSPYNTRRFKGLPPGPISNPGKDAIQAALFPAETNFMYFVAKDDGSREHFFAKTNTQHNRYKVQRTRNQRAN